MSAIDTLRRLKKESQAFADLGGNEETFYDWGSAKILLQTDIKKLSVSKLKNHLEARDSPVNGTKKQLIDRLETSLEEERLQGIAYTEDLEAEFVLNADLEERGSVYSCGSNNAGQLGLGDLMKRHTFTVIPSTRGMGVSQVSAGYSLSFAITEDHDVFVWGGAGAGPMGLSPSAYDNSGYQKYVNPRPIEELIGEEAIQVSVGSSHATAVSKGGDCYVWGYGKCGALGLGNFKNQQTPVVAVGFGETDEIKNVQCGENHTCTLTDKGEIYAWGHAADGRLGIGARERIGAPEDEKIFFPGPSLIGSLRDEFVTQISCGTQHVLAITLAQTYSWGSGSGGRLGHGDFKERWKPCPILSLNEWHVTAVSAGTWHSACIVLVPPLKDGGWVYTWGSGFHGQLGQGEITVSPVPALVIDFCTLQLSVKTIVCGSHHNAAITGEGELYTWGSNANYCLGHKIDSKLVEYTPHPGHVGGFGAIVDRVGRGMPRSVACGKEYTLVATYPYDGPNEDVAQKLMEEQKLRQEDEKLREEEEARRNRRDLKNQQNEQARDEELNFLTGKRLCSLDPNCPGFQVHALKPNICKECGFSSAYHTIIVEEDKDAKIKEASDVLNKNMGSKNKKNHVKLEKPDDEDKEDARVLKSKKNG